MKGKDETKLKLKFLLDNRKDGGATSGGKTENIGGECWGEGERLNSVSGINFGHTSNWLCVSQAKNGDPMEMQIWWLSIYGTGMATRFYPEFLSRNNLAYS